MAIENRSSHKIMPSSVLDHGPNATHMVDMGVLDYTAQVYKLSMEDAATRHLIIPVTISDKTESTDFPPKVQHLASTSVNMKNPMYLRTPYRRWHWTPTSVKISM